MSKLESLYKHSPYLIQHLLFNVYALKIDRQKYGAKFQSALEELRESERWSIEEIREYQLSKVRKIVRHAYETVPFYRNLYDKHQVNPNDLKAFEDFEKLPLVTKEQVKAAGSEIISRAAKKVDMIHGHTSGTTGSPLSLFWDRRTCVHNNALDWRQKGWAGINYGDRIALFLGRAVVNPKRTTPPFWQYDRFHRMLWLSSLHMSTEHLGSIVEKLREFKPHALEGYPSTIYILARFLHSINSTFPVKAVFTSSETLLPTQKELIEDVFKCKVFDFYGMAERVVFATQCAEEHSYHLNFECAYNEIVDSNNNVVSAGNRGYLVGTSLLNYTMPLIRYVTSDITSVSEKLCGCGRSMEVLSAVATKDEDILVSFDGRLISSSAITHPFKPISSIVESQVIQESTKELRVKLVCNDNYRESDGILLVSGLKERLGERMDIKLEFVDEIERTNNGKYRWVISKVPLSI